MSNLWQEIKNRYNGLWTKANQILLLESAVFFVLATVIQGWADQYVGQVKEIAVGDIILNNLPTIDIDFIIVQGALLLTLLIVILLLLKPKYLSFAIKSLALFIIIRSFFISLTHLGSSPDQLSLDTQSIGFGIYNFLYNTRGDFFFSGHTGVPFLFALIFWPEKFWRTLFFLVSALFGVTVLLTHIHYSIDVFAAPFMTYTIFVIAKKIFKDDYALLEI
jgi:hypothetical protein